MNKRIGIIAGSLRKESFSKKVAQEVVKMTPDDHIHRRSSALQSGF
jgi:NAD(P)H-dependent FMN reductase